MTFLFKLSKRVARIRSRALLLAAGAMTLACERGDQALSGPDRVNASTATGNPAAVTDLAVTTATDSSATLSFTEVDDGVSNPANYDVRYAVGPITWGSAASVPGGTCVTPLAGAMIGAKRSCTVLGLRASTAYQFQLVPFRGTLNVNAVFGGLSDVATASTLASPPSATVLLQETFEDASFASRGWYDNTAMVTTTAQHITGSTRALEVHFPAGATTPTWGGAARRAFPATETVYLSYWVKYSTNWVGSGHTYHPHEFLLLTNEDDPWVGPSFTHLTAYVEHNYQNGGIPVLQLQDGMNIDQSRIGQDLTTVTENRAAAGCNGNKDGYPTGCYILGGAYTNEKKFVASRAYFLPSPGLGYKGDWHFVEAYFQLNAIQNGKGVANGIVRYWFDGQLAIDRNNVLLRTGAHPTMKFNQLLVAPYIGDGSPVDQTMWVDDLTVGTGRIGTPIPPSVASVTVTPASASVTVGGTYGFGVTVKDASGNGLTGQTVTWASSDTAVATVSGSGVARGVGAGSATITAASAGISGRAILTVTAPVASVTVTPATVTQNVAGAQQLAATLKDAIGNVLTGRPVTWASSNTAVATVSSTGLETGVAVGTATITATSGGVSGASAITVNATKPGTVGDLAVAARTDTSVTLSFSEVSDGAGKPASYDVRYGAGAISWGSAAEVSRGSCTVPLAGTAIGAKRTCTVLGLTASTGYQFQLVAFRGTLNVNAVFGSLSNVAGGSTAAPALAPVAVVTLSPGSISQLVGATQQLTATLKDASGNNLLGRTITWTSSSPAVAQVNASGLESGVGAGTATITATSEGVSGTSAVTVTATKPSPVADLAVTAKTDTSVTLSFTEVNDGTGKPASYDVRYAASTISWGSAAEVSRGTCAAPVAGTAIGPRRTCTVLGLSVTTGYQFQLVSFRGTLNVNAVFGGLSNIASGTTGAGSVAPVSSVSVSPASLSQTAGTTQQLVAALKDANGNTLTGRSITWTSGNPVVATVNGAGLETSLTTGAATITATSEGKSGTATVTVAAVSSPSGSWPNEPTGVSAISDYGFNDLVPATSDPIGLGGSGWSVLWNPVGNGSLIADAGAPFSPAGVYQVKYPTGFVDGSAPSTVEYVFGSRPTELYWGFWWKPSNPFQSDASGVNKIAFIWTPSGSTDLLYFDLAPNPWRIRCMDDLIAGGGPDAGKRDEPNVTTTAITLGQWHRIEIYVKYSTGSNADGMVKWWVDGQLNGQYTNLKMVQDGGFNRVSFSPTYGGAGGDAKSQADYFWFDHTHLSRKP